MRIIEIKSRLCLAEVADMRNLVVKIDFSLVHKVDDFLELAILQAGSAYVKFFGSDAEVRHLGRRIRESHRNDSACISGAFDHGSKGVLRARAVDRNGRAVAVCCDIPQLFEEIFLQRIDDVGGTVLKRFLQFLIHDIRHNDLLGMMQLHNAEHPCAERSLTVDQDLVVLLNLRAGACLNCNRRRLNQNSIHIPQPLRQNITVLIRDCHVLAVTTVDMDAADSQILADIRSSVPAGVAVSASRHLIDDDPVADLDF